MKFRPLGVTFLIAFLIGLQQPLIADLTIVQRLEDLEGERSSKVEQITLHVSGKKVRIDQGQSMSSMIDSELKTTYSILHESRQYMCLPHDQLKLPRQKKDDKPLDPTSIEPTGLRETIQGYPCHQVLIKESPSQILELWIADDALDMKDFIGEFRSFMEFGMPQSPGEFEKYEALRGIPIQVTEVRNKTPIHRTTITKLSTDKVPASTFEIPAGYEEIKMPDLSKLPSLPDLNSLDLPEDLDR